MTFTLKHKSLFGLLVNKQSQAKKPTTVFPQATTSLHRRRPCGHPTAEEPVPHQVSSLEENQ